MLFLHKNPGRVPEDEPPPIYPRFFPTPVFSTTL
jgi:hypothetical protein